ncbi:MAG TPA: hypothetical protein VKB02_08370 [Pyrinomonadaceae bacterium]|nr:hypothetical protein [Pyrinomonadaceae bacterium]
MLSEPSRRLAGDHHEVDGILIQLEAALEAGDVESVDVRLDLFWARLAVHIRAEHLHLFPVIIAALQQSETSDEGLPSVGTAQTAIARLREDHDFFMHELANAVALVREIRTQRDAQTVRASLNRVARIVSRVKERLAEHNQQEELQVYRWLTLLLEPAELAKLASLINAELGKQPPRFTGAVWTG